MFLSVWLPVCLMFSMCHQVSLGVEGSTMSGSLQRRKKSKRKWKRLWFLLKDKVLYTFTAREVRGHRVSRTGPKNTHTHLFHHDLSRGVVLQPSSIPLHVWPACVSSLNCTFQSFLNFISRRWTTNKGILCALSFPFFLQVCNLNSLKLKNYHRSLKGSPTAAQMPLLSAKFDISFFFFLFRIKWLQKVCLCRASLWSWQRALRKKEAVAACFICTTRKPSTTRSKLMINTLHAGQQRQISRKAFIFVKEPKDFQVNRVFSWLEIKL